MQVGANICLLGTFPLEAGLGLASQNQEEESPRGQEDGLHGRGAEREVRWLGRTPCENRVLRDRWAQAPLRLGPSGRAFIPRTKLTELPNISKGDEHIWEKVGVNVVINT